MSAHDHPGLSNITDLAVAVAFLQRVLSVHEIASCHFDLGSFDVVNVPLVDGTAAFLREIGPRGVLEVGLQKAASSSMFFLTTTTKNWPTQPGGRAD